MEDAAQAAVLFADVSASTRLYEVAGDALASVAVEKCLALFRQTTQAAGGRVLRIVGDEVLALFPTADAAANAAMAMQNGIAEFDPVAGFRLGVRIGFNFGRVVERDGELFGDSVNVAARLARQAQKDQIITSSETLDSMSPALKGSCRRLYSVQVKGKENEVELCEVMWRHSEDVTALVKPVGPPGSRRAALRLRYRGAEITLDAARSSLSLGRDKSAELVIEDAKASRAHCKLERRMDKFVIVDHSANGTYLTLEGDREMVLRREEFTLRGRGWITFGQPRAEAAEAVEFVCEG